MPPMSMRSFEQWVACIFDHPVGEPAWYWAAGADHGVEGDDGLNVEYLTRLFAGCSSVLRPFDDAQVNQGLNLIANPSCSDHAYTVLTRVGVPWPQRRDCIRSIFDLYAGCFAPRCARALSHCGDPRCNPLNYICYMWWEVFPTWGDPADPADVAELEEVVGVADRCLALPHPACVEGALHGLGHWQLIVPHLVEPVIDRFLVGRARDFGPKLVDYARRGRDGAIQ